MTTRQKFVATGLIIGAMLAMCALLAPLTKGDGSSSRTSPMEECAKSCTHGMKSYTNGYPIVCECLESPLANHPTN